MIQNPAVTAVHLHGTAVLGVLAQNLPAATALCKNAADTAAIKPAPAVLGRLALQRQAYATPVMYKRPSVSATMVGR